MNVALAFLMLGSLLVFVISLLYLLYAAIKKKPLMIAGVCSVVSLVLLIGSLVAFQPEKEQSASNDTPITTDEPQKSDKKSNNNSIEQQQQDFLKFHADFMALAKECDATWIQYNDTVNKMGNAQIDRYQAYDNMIALSDTLLKQSKKIGNLHAPKSLSESQQKKINDAMWTYSNALDFRRNATQKVADMINTNNANPKDVAAVKKSVDDSTEFIINALAGLVQVGKDLKVEEKMVDKKQ